MRIDKIVMYVLLILMAIPVPFSVISWIGTLISIGGLSMVNWTNFQSAFNAIIGLLVMIFAGSYVVTYCISLTYTLAIGKLSWITIIPIGHLILCFLLYKVWK